MKPEQAAQLRAPFPENQIGILPKPYKKESPKSYCRECHTTHGMPAVHLAYVGHAATTDRLLQVDPEWTWEPFATDADGLPAIKNGNLWIRLTVCGVTRNGVGDGVSLKEAIGDAIRNAAMRFGVALDLWAKEDLHADNAERGVTPDIDTTTGEIRPAPAAEPVSDAWDTATPAKTSPGPAAPTGLASPEQVKKLQTLFSNAPKKLDRAARIDYVRQFTDRPEISSFNDLTPAEAHQLINYIEGKETAS